MELWVAVVSGVFMLAGISLTAVFQFRQFRHENEAQHGKSLALLSRVDERSAITLDRVEHVSERLDDHLEAHRVEGQRVQADPQSD